MSSIITGAQLPERPLTTLGISGRLKHRNMKANGADIQVGCLVSSVDATNDVGLCTSAAEHLRPVGIADQPKENVAKGTWYDLPATPTKDTTRYIFSDNENVPMIELTPGDEIFVACADSDDNIYYGTLVVFDDASDYVELMKNSLAVTTGTTAVLGTAADGTGDVGITGEDVPKKYKFQALKYRAASATASWLPVKVIGW